MSFIAAEHIHFRAINSATVRRQTGQKLEYLQFWNLQSLTTLKVLNRLMHDFCGMVLVYQLYYLIEILINLKI